MLHPVLRCYTAPTCTLEITANVSALSQWTARPVLKQLRFQLSLDDLHGVATERVTIRGDRTQLELLHSAIEAYVQGLLVSDTGVLIATVPEAGDDGANGDRAIVPPGVTLTAQEDSAASASGIFLKPRGLLSHHFHLGALATTPSQPILLLSALQLADVATVLDAYATEVIVLPRLLSPGRSLVPPQWLRTAAAVLVTAGVTITGMRLLDRSPSVPASSTAQAPDQLSMATPIAPATPAPILVPLSPATASPNVNSPFPTVAPAVTTATRSPDLGKNSGLGLDKDRSQPSATSSTSLPPDLTYLPSPPAIPPGSGTISRFERAAPQAQPPNLKLTPLPQRVVSVPPPVTEITPLPQGGFAASDATAPAPQPVASGANAQPSMAQPSLSSRAAAPSATPSGEARRDRTAFDTVPQVAEARSYFQARWQPPQGLTQVLEYSLILSPDGSIQRIVPLGQAAGDFIDRTGMPLTGEPFVSPTQSKRIPRLRVVLSPDGSVRTFVERFDP